MTGEMPRRGRGRPALDAASAVDDLACLRVALNHFADNGFDGTSVREIARELQVSHGLLNAKFGSKIALWEAAVGYGMDAAHAHMSRLATPAGQPSDIVARMQTACRNFVLGLAENTAIVRLMNVEGTRKSARLDYVTRTFFRGRIWPFQTLLAEGQALGIFRQVNPAVPFTLLAHGAGGILALQPMVQMAVPGLSTQPQSLIDAALEAADMIVRGLLVDETP